MRTVEINIGNLRLNVVCSRCCQNHNFTLLFWRMTAQNCSEVRDACTCSAMTFPHSTNDIVALSLPLPSVMLKLPNMIG